MRPLVVEPYRIKKHPVGVQRRVGNVCAAQRFILASCPAVAFDGRDCAGSGQRNRLPPRSFGSAHGHAMCTRTAHCPAIRQRANRAAIARKAGHCLDGMSTLPSNRASTGARSLRVPDACSACRAIPSSARRLGPAAPCQARCRRLRCRSARRHWPRSAPLRASS